MNWNTISNSERLLLWKKLRSDINHLSIDDMLDKLAKFCFHMPIGSRSIDYYSPKEWPTPWEILYYGTFCTSSISLLIFYTLILIDIKYTIELYLVEDNDDIYLLPIIDNQYILNYELGKINIYTDVKNNFKILQKYSKEQIKSIT